MNDYVEEGKYCENCDGRGYECDRSGGWVNKPDEVDTGLTAQFGNVDEIQ